MPKQAAGGGACDRCGSDRAGGDHRHRVTLDDDAGSSGDHTVLQVCRSCYREIKGNGRGLDDLPNGLPPVRFEPGEEEVRVRWWSRSGDMHVARLSAHHGSSGEWALVSFYWEDREATYTVGGPGPDPTLSHIHPGIRDVLEARLGPLVALGGGDPDPMDVLAHASDGGDDPLDASEAVDRVDPLTCSPRNTGEIVERARERGYVEEAERGSAEGVSA